ncbi:MAG: DUF5667 domain-containing protein [Candidatus Daviesbacteria bacterium]|nr:DUF5667 domain-containing protein [Candidatus Daviesbacteria bacterium]
MRSKFVLVILLLFLNFTLLISPAYAQSPDIGQARINAASPLYFLKSIQEILQLKFAKTPNDRYLNRLKFITRRVAEVKSLAGTSREDLIEPTLEKYWSQFQELRSTTNLKDWETAKKVSYGMVAQMDSLQTVFTQVSNPRAKRSVRLAVNRISEWEGGFMGQIILFGQPALTQDIINSRLSGCNFLSKEASSSALNEVEKTVFVERAKKCFPSLGK